jgi:hypothetical protein
MQTPEDPHVDRAGATILLIFIIVVLWAVFSQ